MEPDRVERERTIEPTDDLKGEEDEREEVNWVG